MLNRKALAFISLNILFITSPCNSQMEAAPDFIFVLNHTYDLKVLHMVNQGIRGEYIQATAKSLFPGKDNADFIQSWRINPRQIYKLKINPHDQIQVESATSEGFQISLNGRIIQFDNTNLKKDMAALSSALEQPTASFFPSLIDRAYANSSDLFSRSLLLSISVRAIYNMREDPRSWDIAAYIRDRGEMNRLQSEYEAAAIEILNKCHTDMAWSQDPKKAKDFKVTRMARYLNDLAEKGIYDRDRDAVSPKCPEEIKKRANEEISYPMDSSRFEHACKLIGKFIDCAKDVRKKMAPAQTAEMPSTGEATN